MTRHTHTHTPGTHHGVLISKTADLLDARRQEREEQAAAAEAVAEVIL
jgi:hypothetical protein